MRSRYNLHLTNYKLVQTETNRQPKRARDQQSQTEINSQPARFVNRGINHTFIYIYLPGFKSYIFGKKSERQKRVNIIWISHQQHLNQLEAAVEDMTYMIYLHVISVMTWAMLTLTDYWTWYRTIMGGVNLLGLDCGSGRGPNVYDASVYYYIFKMKYKSKLIV